VRILLLLLTLISLNSFGQDIIKDTIKLNEVNISALSYKANNLTPITFKNLTKSDIDNKNFGQEPSYILNTTPSITQYSESGGENGYSYIRLRGIDQTRINFTLNGVPLNEPEDQGCYFSNYPDFFSAVDNVQIQRGSGLNKNGSSSYGGSLILESYKPNPFNVTTIFGFGSYGAGKISAQVQNKWKKGSFYIQLSDMTSDGYKYHSGNHSRSAFFVGNFEAGKNHFKLAGFAGEQENQLAWLGAPMDSIEKNRRYNACTANENDHFTQYHLQFHHTIDINSKSKFDYCIYYNFLDGHYSFDLNNFLNILEPGPNYTYWLTSNWVGAYTNYFIKIKNLDISVGAHGYTYNRQHIGTEETTGFLYKNNGYRNEMSAFTKANYNLFKDINLFGDIQYRYTDFKYVGNATLPNFYWNFINYNVGMDIKILKRAVIYYSFGRTNREPTRNDILMGNDNLLCDTCYNNIKPEQSYDNELGVRYLDKNLNLNFNLFYMDFNNEITLNGQFGPTGLPLHENVDKSVRKGCELDLKYKFNFGMDFCFNSTYNISEIDQNGNVITQVLTPKWLVNSELDYKYKWFKVGISYRYQDWSYIDFANKYPISSFYTIGANAGIKFNWFELDIYLSNITNQKYLASGQLNYDGSHPLYFVGSPFNFFTTIKINMGKW